MEDIIQLLSDSSIVESYEILNLLQDEDFYYLKIKSIIIDKTILHIRIYLSDEEYNYAFHWQAENGERILRWDNAPHHKDISTFPHHLHNGQGIKISYTITLNDILKEIMLRMDKTKSKIPGR